MIKSNTHNEYITKAKHKELTAELEHLKTVERKEIANRLDEARSLGDLSENAEYHDAREKQSDLESKIDTIEGILNTAKIVTGKKSDSITVGSHVSLQKKGSKALIEYEVVGSAEADMLAHKLSHESPLGKIMIGKKVGDSVTLEAPKGKIKYTIKKLA